jgi:hypothetical protein
VGIRGEAAGLGVEKGIGIGIGIGIERGIETGIGADEGGGGGGEASALGMEIAGKVVHVWSGVMCSLRESMTSGWGMAGRRVNVHLRSSSANGFGFGSGH